MDNVTDLPLLLEEGGSKLLILCSGLPEMGAFARRVEWIQNENSLFPRVWLWII